MNILSMYLYTQTDRQTDRMIDKQSKGAKKKVDLYFLSDQRLTNYTIDELILKSQSIIIYLTVHILSLQYCMLNWWDHIRSKNQS